MTTRNGSAYRLDGRIALVTGGNRGIGRAVALALVDAGAAVAILGRSTDRNAAVLDELRLRGGRAIAITADVADPRQIEVAVETVQRRLGDVDVLVNNAGITVAGGLLDVALEDWERVLATNLTACLVLSRLVAQRMVRRRGGKIVNVASESSRFASPYLIAYGASKAALLQLTRTMAAELGRHAVQVNAIVPGWIDTPLAEPLKTRPIFREVLARTPAGRLGTAEECAAAVVFLASAAADFITGAALAVDGGYAIR